MIYLDFSTNITARTPCRFSRLVGFFNLLVVIVLNNLSANTQLIELVNLTDDNFLSILQLFIVGVKGRLDFLGSGGLLE